MVDKVEKIFLEYEKIIKHEKKGPKDHASVHHEGGGGDPPPSLSSSESYSSSFSHHSNRN